MAVDKKQTKQRARSQLSSPRGSAHARCGNKTPLAMLRRWLLKPEGQRNWADEYYERTVHVTEQQPRSILGWAERANAAGFRALCGRGDPVALWSDVIMCGQLLDRMGARRRAERAWAEAAMYTAGQPVADELEKHHDLRSLIAGLKHYRVGFDPPRFEEIPARPRPAPKPLPPPSPRLAKARSIVVCLGEFGRKARAVIEFEKKRRCDDLTGVELCG